ncbi:MAG TPA: hypothetical protein VE954_29910 [Oligoflexus sp.]|uniref:hypothetical protein n=1 Tax=Oligoflexus sp. TaxID=1971216 RepID=UPI002D4D5235|nr:hypothetical protein [Oligoflexus sp.]HYX37339.1 hypothetical protein [Oligoflexus sp.]
MRHIVALTLLSLPIWSCKVKKPAENAAIVSAQDGMQKSRLESLEVYPVDATDHVQDKTLDVADPSQFNPNVSNVVAYARYGYSAMTSGKEVGSTDPTTLATAVAQAAEKTGIKPADVVRYSLVRGSDDDYLAARSKILKDAEGATPQTKLPRLAKRIVDTAKQLDACSSERGQSMRDCCTSLGFTSYFIDTDEVPSPAQRENLRLLASQAEFYTTYMRRRLDLGRKVEGGAIDEPSKVFEHLGIKAWLSVCAPVLTQAPATLDEAKELYGDYSTGVEWQQELHPRSLAKMAGRRIYRKGYGKMRVSVAESLNDACEIRETEIIVSRASSEKDFYSYGPEGTLVSHGYFPARLGVDSIKFTPDSCMGCHYTFDTREFSVQAPSFVALNLIYREVAGVPQWKDHSHCQLPRDRVIEHASKVFSSL